MGFYNWMMKNYKKDPTVKGTLARSMSDDPWWPTGLGVTRKTRIRKYLINCCHPSDNCVKAFDECWKEYEDYENARKRN